MTTIAYRDGILAADSRCTYGNEIDSDQVAKLTKTKDGRLLAGCGAAALVTKYMEAIKGRCEFPVMGNDDGRVIEVTRAGKIIIHERGGSYSLGKPKFGAWGSGSGIAKGAMHMGADARRAVQIAIKEDHGCGGKIRSVTLK